MKLISLYIENFGGLSQYSLSFGDGLTVVQEPNGFGKTTLAEFIRAMFYGFPRKARQLDKSRRQKYTPWQGGKFGGNLVFELQGERYRIERTFGATPKGDSFTLIDLGTNKKSNRFSEDIGLELFQLDADSFERSTYMPQVHDLNSLTTDGIQAKLGNLVEDTNDVGNYDKAVAALRAARSGYIPYRGSGGTVAEAQNQISRLQEELERTSRQKNVLADTEESIIRLENQLEACRQQKENIRKRLDLALEADSVASVQREYGKLTDREQQLSLDLNELNRRYPKGVPSEELISEIRRVAAEASVLAGRTVTTREDQEAAAYLKENSRRFANGVPVREELEQYRILSNEYLSLGTEAETIGLSEGERLEYEKLLPLYQAGALDEKRLEALDAANRELTRKRHELEGIHFPAEELQRLNVLKQYFAPGIPQEEEILARRQELAEADTMRREKTRFQAKTNPLLMLLWLLAALGIGVGLWLLVSRALVWSGIALGLGAAALIGLVAISVRSVGADERKRADLEHNVTAFAERYTATKPLSDALHEIRDNLEDYRKLGETIQMREDRRRRLSNEIDLLAGQIEAELEENLIQFSDCDRGILELHLARNQFLDLQGELTEANERIEALNAQIAAHRQRICAFLGSYFEEVQPEQFHSLLSELQRDSERYVRSRERVAAWQQRKQQHDRQMEECETTLTRFFDGFGLTRTLDVREQLLRIRDDSRTDWGMSRELAQLRLEIAEFTEKHRKELAVAVPEIREDMTQLRLEEQRITEEMGDISEQLLRRRQRRSQIGDQLSLIPVLQDELAQWREKRSGDQQKAKILDDTMVFLEKARENLQNSYLGPVRSSFRGYMERLLGERAEQILLTPDLEVQLERKGQARELGYFSAGQTDTVMLCMRLALVDALFTEVKPFVILDDPFVNLDDTRTAEALALLRELAEERQIIYLVCNSSRNFE